MFRRTRSEGRRRGRRLFFATDIHGSEACFRKFINAARVYGVDDLVLGGDITGKVMVPIVVGTGGTYSCTYGDHRWVDLDASGLVELKQHIRRRGHYYLLATPEEIAKLDDEGHRDQAFRQAVRASIRDWVGLAEERLGRDGVRLFVAPGNDDFLEIDEDLEGSDVVTFAEGSCVRIDDSHEMITTGYSNPTPWHTERELTERDLRAKIDAMAAQAQDPSQLVVVIHPPPRDTRIDQAPKLDPSLRPVLDPGGGYEMTSVGSQAVREFIEAVQPLLGLHGHVHEAAGVISLGRTLCINPGSEYGQGVLRGTIVELDGDRPPQYQFVTG